MEFFSSPRAKAAAVLKTPLGHSREAGVELGAKLLDRQDGVLVLRMRSQGLFYAAAETVAGQRDVAPET